MSQDLVVRPALVKEAVRLLSGDDAIVRSRAADALEKASRVAPAILGPHKRELLRLASVASQQELRWHLAQMLPRLELTARQRMNCLALLRGYLGDRSRIVTACALEALWDLGEAGGVRPQWIRAVVERSALTGSPSLKARARRILRKVRNG